MPGASAHFSHILFIVNEFIMYISIFLQRQVSGLLSLLCCQPTPPLSPRFCFAAPPPFTHTHTHFKNEVDYELFEHGKMSGSYKFEYTSKSLY